MRRRRFYVAAVRGYRIHPDTGRIAERYLPGLSAHVLDRERLHIVLASYYSEDRVPKGRGARGERLGARGAIAAAREKARELNGWDRAQR